MAKPIRIYGKDTQFFLSDGTVANGGLLFQYQAGTSTKANTYTDNTKATANDNPLVLNSAGRPTTDIYIDQSMKFVFAPSTDTDPPAAAIWTIDNISAVDQLWQTVSKSIDYTTLETDNHKLITVDASGATKTITLLAAATAGAGFMQAVKKVDSSTNTVTIDPNSTETIDSGHTTYVLRNQNDNILFISDGTNWQVLGLFFGEAIQDGASAFAFSKGITITAEDARTDTVDRPLTITSTTSGVAAAGIGTGILIQGESADESPSDFGAVDFTAGDVTAGSEDTYLDIFLRVAGAALTRVWRFASSAVFSGVFTHANTAERTYTLPDTDITGWVAQRVSTTSTTSASTTTAIPLDDTIPQNTEGAEYITLAITPKNAANILVIEFLGFVGADAANQQVMVALFQDSTADALQVSGAACVTSGLVNTIALKHIMAAGTTSATTFKIRFGQSSTNTAYMLRRSTSDLFSTANSAVFMITEYSA